VDPYQLIDPAETVLRMGRPTILAPDTVPPARRRRHDSIHPVANGAPEKGGIRSTENGDGCRAGDLSSDRPTRGCTAVIKAGEWIIAQLVAAYNNRGVALRPNGELDRAIEDYDQAIRLMPDYYVAINNRGVALMARGELDRAIADFDRVIQLKPDYLAAFGGRIRA